MIRRSSGVLAAIFGLVMVLGSVVLLYWNEGRAVTARRALDLALQQVVEAEAAAPSPGTEGKLVHLSGMMETSAPARDSVFGVGGELLLRVRRTVEMFQWREHKEGKTDNLSYSREWSADPIDSSGFREPGHGNPPMPARSATIDSPDVRLGIYRISAGVLENVSAFTPLTLRDPPAGYRNIGDLLYRGSDPADPQIGDLRIRFAGVPAQTMSVVAGLDRGVLAPFRGAGGYEIALASPGVESAAEMLHDKQDEEETLTWVLRATGFLLMVIGVALVWSPVAALVSGVPLVRGVVDGAILLVALTVAVPATLITIAVAWFAHRPLLAGVLVAIGAGAAIAIRVLHARRPAPAGRIGA